MAEMTITVLCDDINGAMQGFKKDPGFAAAIKTGHEIILFDTGMYAANLSNNLDAAGIHAEDIDAVILSHNHNDHVDGLTAIFNKNPDIPVYIHNMWEKGIAFQGMNIPVKNKQKVENPGKQAGLPKNILITSPLYSADYDGIREQAVMILLKNSFIFLCGCCHPGLTDFLALRESLGIDKEMPFHVLGGMHQFGFPDKVAVELKSRIQSIILCHCTHNIELFKRQFEDKCELAALGKKYHFE